MTMLEPILSEKAWRKLSPELQAVYVKDPDAKQLSDKTAPVRLYVLNTPDVINTYPHLDRAWWQVPTDPDTPDGAKRYTCVPQVSINGKQKSPSWKGLMPPEAAGEPFYFDKHGHKVWSDPPAEPTTETRIVDTPGGSYKILEDK